MRQASSRQPRLPHLGDDSWRTRHSIELALHQRYFCLGLGQGGFSLAQEGLGCDTPFLGMGLKAPDIAHGFEALKDQRPGCHVGQDGG